jgi:hypothetical protein
MKTEFKGGLRTRAQVGLVKNLGTFFRRITAIRVGVFREGIAAGMFAAECLPYEASKSYRAIKTELECKRSEIQLDLLRVRST